MNPCDRMRMITTYLYFNNFLFNWCLVFIKCKKFLILREFFVLVFQFVDCVNLFILMILNEFLYNFEKNHLYCLQDHLTLHSFQIKVLL